MSNFALPKVAPFLFPKSAHYDRIVAKEKIFKQANVSVAIKKLFNSQIDRVRCLYELSSDGLNLASSESVPKILIIQLILKQSSIDLKILKTIDRAFGVPVYFELQHEKKVCYCASYRSRNETNKSQWKFSEYYFSEWLEKDYEAVQLPVVLNLSLLYEQLIKALIPLQEKQGESLSLLINRMDKIRALESDIEKLQNKVNKEKQFNRRVELNKTLNTLKQNLLAYSNRELSSSTVV